MSLIQKDPTRKPEEATPPPATPPKPAQATPPQPAPTQPRATAPPSFVTSGTDYDELLRDYPSNQGFVINWEGVTSSGQNIWAIFKNVQYPAAPGTSRLLTDIYAGAGPEGSQKIAATGTDVGQLREEYPGYVIALTTNTTREGLPLYAAYAPPGPPPKPPTAPELFTSLSESLKPEPGGGYSLSLQGKTIEFPNLGEAQSFIGSYIAGANFPLYTSGGGGGGILYSSQQQAKDVALAAGISAALTTIKPAPQAKGYGVMPDSAGFSAFLGGKKYYFTSKEEATAFIVEAYNAPNGFNIPQIQLGPRVYSFTSMASALAYVYTPPPITPPKIDPITKYVHGIEATPGTATQTLAEIDQRLILQNMVGPFPYPVTVSKGGMVIARFMSMADANAYIARMNAPKPIGYNEFPGWGVLGTFATGALRTPEFIERDVENLVNWGKAQPSPYVRFGAGFVASLGAVGVVTTGLFTLNLEPSFKLAGKEPGLIPSEIVGIGFGALAFGEGWGAFESATRISTLPFAAQSAIRFEIGNVLGYAQSRDVTTGLESGLIFAGIPAIGKLGGFARFIGPYKVPRVIPSDEGGILTETIGRVPTEETSFEAQFRASANANAFEASAEIPQGRISDIQRLGGIGPKGINPYDVRLPSGQLEIEQPGKLIGPEEIKPAVRPPMPGDFLKGFSTPITKVGSEDAINFRSGRGINPYVSRDFQPLDRTDVTDTIFRRFANMESEPIEPVKPLKPMKPLDFAEPIKPTEYVNPNAMSKAEFEQAFSGPSGVDYAKSLAQTRGSPYEYAGVEPPLTLKGYPSGTELGFVPLTTPESYSPPVSKVVDIAKSGFSFVPITDTELALGFGQVSKTSQRADAKLQTIQAQKSVTRQEELPAFRFDFELEDFTRLDLRSDYLLRSGLGEANIFTAKPDVSQATREITETTTTTILTQAQLEAFRFDWPAREEGRYEFPFPSFPGEPRKRTAKKKTIGWEFWEQKHGINYDPLGLFGKPKRGKRR